MIGAAHAPSEGARKRLDSILGEGRYSVSYRQTATGVDAVVALTGAAYQELTIPLSVNPTREQTDAAWSAMLDALAESYDPAVGSLKLTPDHNAADDRATVEEPSPSNEPAKPEPPAPPPSEQPPAQPTPPPQPPANNPA